MFNNFGFESSKILKLAEEERYNLSHPYVGSEHLLLALLKSDTLIKKKLNEYNLSYKRFRDELIKIVGVPKKNIEVNLYTPLLKRILSSALSDAKENNDGKVLRLAFPELNEERRKQIVKDIKKIAEESKVSIRALRRDGLDKAKKEQKDGNITEDDLKNAENENQEAIEKTIVVQLKEGTDFVFSFSV